MTSQIRMFFTCLALLLPLMEARQSVNIRAAFYSGGSLYLFNDEFQVLIANGNGGSTVYSQSILGAPSDYSMSAAFFFRSHFGFPEFVYLGDETIYDGRVLHFEADASSYANKFPDFLWHSVDAATNEGAVDYYFKGCEYITRSSSGAWDTAVKSVSDLGIPCDVDAAWNDGSNTMVLKGNQLWVVGGDNSPQAFDDYLQQDKWEL